ncbi:GNAT family N-acetyltransferase [Emticicia sp. CRIBPO]|uniref:GNAT family N-acetyltransferase n=1 Tax=Emticicia sp. CRIBPO TaxID=2683258 RepID=UPI0014136EA2|nr:GNAT family N-acetyltransferase [Emticicia sp. CRIBPO]NBA85487.1 GNAT family N-acetyltransferase [Emticicia sp. CRIBPO]
MSDLHFVCKSFQELSLQELYEVLALRQRVFIVEQNCPFLDADGKDQYAMHCLGYDEEGKITAYTRIFDENISYEGFLSIGRVVSDPDARGLGYGKQLMEYSIQKTLELFGPKTIKIGAQAYLEKFYNGFGFKSTGYDYVEDGIDHKIMTL